jgi:peptidoglycan-associated lipoprotein
MLRKQWFVFILIGLFALALGACAKKPATKVETAPESEAAEQPAAPVEEVTESPQAETPAVQMPVLGDVFFEFDQSKLTDEGKQALTENARQLKEGGMMAIIIEGHCDERGTNAYNLALGEKRANMAKEYLVSLGVDGARIQTISYGEERPFDQGHNEAAWSKNRRAHFVVNQ